MIYTMKLNGTIKQPDGHHKHPTRYIVKRLSGPLNGAITTVASVEDARREAFHLSDIEGICSAIYPPVYGA